MTTLNLIDELKDTISFNIFVTKDDGRVAWSVTPVVIDQLYSDRLSESSLTPQGQQLETQSKPTDSELFTEFHIELCLPIPPYNPNHGTVRIYANSLHLSSAAEPSVHPSVITVERAALCKVFLETKYHKTLQQPSERDQRRQTLETLVSKGKQLDADKKHKFEQILKSVESEWSRLSRVRPSIEAFDVEKKLGSGGFGVVNMVREKLTSKVYAMKEKTLRLGHEGRALCERDLLKKASESGSRWICKLHYAFQDMEALHLVLEYMGGGDFLTLLLQKAPLKEDETRFYIAEMINGIDACHKLGFMHRDVKPDNFLVSSNGHLKIADFGLATSGEWIYQESYRSSRRKELLKKYHQALVEEGAEKTLADHPSHDQELATNHETLHRMHAESVVGTYYYMAPEVLQGEKYNATADWWSLGIILYECLFGYPPFWAKNRRATQKVILDWKNSLEIPFAPRTSDSAKRLVRALLCGSIERLRTPTWEIDLSVQRGHPVSAMYRMQVFKQDIRNHPFFRTINLDFERIHLEMAPVLPIGKSSTREIKNTQDNTDGKQIKTKDIMLHDERVLNERRHGAFKNYTYRGPDLTVVLDRFTKAIDNEDFP